MLNRWFISNFIINDHIMVIGMVYKFTDRTSIGLSELTLAYHSSLLSEDALPLTLCFKNTTDPDTLCHLPVKNTYSLDPLHRLKPYSLGVIRYQIHQEAFSEHQCLLRISTEVLID